MFSNITILPNEELEFKTHIYSKDIPRGIFWLSVIEKESNIDTFHEIGVYDHISFPLQINNSLLYNKQQTESVNSKIEIGIPGIIRFTRGDPRWAYDKINSSFDIGSVNDGKGCLLTSLAMIFQASGVPANPHFLNNYYKYNNPGFSSSTEIDRSSELRYID